MSCSKCACSLTVSLYKHLENARTFQSQIIDFWNPRRSVLSTTGWYRHHDVIVTWQPSSIGQVFDSGWLCSRARRYSGMVTVSRTSAGCAIALHTTSPFSLRIDPVGVIVREEQADDVGDAWSLFSCSPKPLSELLSSLSRSWPSPRSRLSAAMSLPTSRASRGVGGESESLEFVLASFARPDVTMEMSDVTARPLQVLFFLRAWSDSPSTLWDECELCELKGRVMKKLVPTESSGHESWHAANSSSNKIYWSSRTNYFIE